MTAKEVSSFSPKAYGETEQKHKNILKGQHLIYEEVIKQSPLMLESNRGKISHFIERT